MLMELEDLSAKWGVCLFVLGLVLSFLKVVTGVLQEKSVSFIFILSGMLIAASFGLYRAQMKSLDKKIHKIARTNPPIGRKKLALITWLILISLPFGVLGLKLIGVADGTNFYDFGAYYNAGERVINGHPLYDWNTAYSGVTSIPDSPDRYLYAPVVSLLFVPFTYLPFETAALAWSAFSITVYLAGISTFLKSLTISLSRREWMVVLTASLGFGPFIVTFIAGQVTGILTGMLCFAGAAYQNHERKGVLSSILTTITVVFKVYYAPAGAPLLRDRRRLLTALATGTSIILLGMFVFNFQTTIEYFKVLAGGKGWGSATDPPIAWNINDFHPFYYLGSIGYIVRGLLLATIATVAYRSRHHGFEYVDVYVYSLGLLGIVLGVPVFATSGLTVTVPVILFLLVTTIHDRPGVFVVTLVATLLIHAHPYTNEFLSGILLPSLGAEAFASAILPVVQPAVWGVFLLLAVVTYEYTRRLSERPT